MSQVRKSFREVKAIREQFEEKNPRTDIDETKFV